jgi:hypothetical protein
MRRLQPTLPLLEADGRTHRRDCDCPRCDAGFRLSESERAQAARRWDEQQARQAAEVALEKKRARQHVKALKTTLALEEQERRTAEQVRALADVRARLQTDPRLHELLASRRAGRSIPQAIAEAERRRQSS